MINLIINRNVSIKMQKLALILISLILIILDAKGQSSNHYVLSPISFIHNNDVSINLISSEVLNSSSFASESEITQGFLQPENYLFLDIEQQKSSFFRFFPNPVNEGVFVEFKKECGSQMNCSIYDLLGQKVKEISIVIDFQNKIYLDLSQLQHGIYLMTFLDIEKGLSSTSKLLKQ